MRAMPFMRLALVAACLATGCTNGQIAVPPAPAVADTSSFALQFSVGTATIPTAANGNLPPYGAAVTGLNVVATFRSADGHSATLQNTPTLTAPKAMVFANAQGIPANVLPGMLPSQLIALTSSLQGTGPAPNIPPDLIGYSFGVTTGVFGNGFSQNELAQAVLNEYTSLTQNTCYGYFPSGGGQGVTQPYAQIIRAPGNHCALVGSQVPPYPIAQAFVGGPPAWPLIYGNGNFTSFQGYPINFLALSAPPVAGTYQFDVAYPTSNDYSTYGHVDATATLKTAAPVLPVVQTPSLTVSPDGSGVVQVVLPAGVTEAIVAIDADDCDRQERVIGQSAYAVVAKQTGSNALFVPASLGRPNNAGAPTHTFCTISDAQAYAESPGGQPKLTQSIEVSVVGFDYPAYETAYPFNLAQRPKLTGANGQSDVTFSQVYMTLNTVSAK